MCKKLVDTTDTGTEYDALDGSENVPGWESTMVDSLLNKHRPGSSWMKKRKGAMGLESKLLWADDGQRLKMNGCHLIGLPLSIGKQLTTPLK